MGFSLLAVVIALGAPASATDQLRVTYWAQGRERGTPLRWTLRCDPAGGTLPRAAAACPRLARMKAPFEPIPRNSICTEIYGGPQEAIVAGTYAGRRIWIRLARRNGCEISRFDRLRFLVPAFAEGGP
ncbi:MAG: hypothetical protein H0T61_14515 [Actinobacteria bacterium]|nr:hypothetical protein [Actinomycetota bacterium]